MAHNRIDLNNAKPFAQRIQQAIRRVENARDEVTSILKSMEQMTDDPGGAPTDFSKIVTETGANVDPAAVKEAGQDLFDSWGLLEQRFGNVNIDNALYRINRG